MPTVTDRDGFDTTVAMLKGFVREMNARVLPNLLDLKSKTVQLPSGARFEVIHPVQFDTSAEVTYFDEYQSDAETMTGPAPTAIIDSIAALTEINPADRDAIFDLGMRALDLHLELMQWEAK
jgi:hypothetical protein